MRAHRKALTRTTLLINSELFDGKADPGAIADVLWGSCVRLRAEHPALHTRAGQSAIVTAHSLVARLGITIELEIPNPALGDCVAPLRRPLLRDALAELGADLVPGALTRTKRGKVDSAFAIGSAAKEPEELAVSVSDFGLSIERGADSASCDGDLPFGGLAAGAAIAAIALERAVPAIEAATGLSARAPRPSPGPPLRLNLLDLFPSLATRLQLHLGELDLISGGAITNAFLFCLLRVPGLNGSVRVIEPDVAELSNVNRYALLRASQAGLPKTALLEAAATDALRIRGVDSLFTTETRARLEPLAKRVLVGVDDVEARWWVQEAEPVWLAIGATANHLAQLTSHVLDSPCAACLHPVPLAPQEIPTISFVSFWAGLLQACAVLAPDSNPTNLSIYPFALGAAMPSFSAPPAASARCPLGCAASRTRAGAAR